MLAVFENTPTFLMTSFRGKQSWENISRRNVNQNTTNQQLSFKCFVKSSFLKVIPKSSVNPDDKGTLKHEWVKQNPTYNSHPDIMCIYGR